ACKQLNSFSTKHLLQASGNVEGFFALSRNINQKEDQAALNGLKIEEISSYARCTVEGGDAGRLQAGYYAGLRLAQEPLHGSLAKRQFHKSQGNREGRIPK